MQPSDPQAATAAYVDSLGAAALAGARAYTLGNHWLILGGLPVPAIVTWLMVRSGVLEALFARLRARGWALRTFLMSATYLIVSGLLALPWTIYESWYRATIIAPFPRAECAMRAGPGGRCRHPAELGVRLR